MTNFTEKLISRLTLHYDNTTFKAKDLPFMKNIVKFCVAETAKEILKEHNEGHWIVPFIDKLIKEAE